MLNIFAGFQMAADLVGELDFATARGVLESLSTGVTDWLSAQESPDPDIQDDLTYVGLFLENILVAEENMDIQMPPPETQPEPWPND